jgi:hypothetical protein
MPKNRDKSSEEWLRGQIRELTKENRSLKKENMQLKRRKHHYEDLKIITELGDEAIKESAPVNINPCPTCTEGTISLIMNLEDREIHACSDCHFRKVVKK